MTETFASLAPAPLDLDNHQYSIETRLIHWSDPDGAGPVVPDIPATATYTATSVDELADRFLAIIQCDPARDHQLPLEAIQIYQRLGNRVELLLAQGLALAQGGETAIVFSDGMSAIKASVSFRTHFGDEVIAGVPVYGCTDNLFTKTLPAEGRKVKFLDLSDASRLKSAISKRTRVVYVETLANPNLRMADLPAIKRIITDINQQRYEAERITLVVDNTFATPYCCNPFALDPALEDMIVLHSTTKGINGFAQGLGGVAVIPWKYWKSLYLHRKDNGGILSPQESHHLLTKSLKTLGMRLRTAQANARHLAEAIVDHPLVEQVGYPGLPSFLQYDLARRMLVDWHGNFAPGHMMTLLLKGDTPDQQEARGRALLDYLASHSKAYILAVSLGYLGTLMEDPNGGTHATIPDEERREKGIPRGLLRFSIGCETTQDLIVDMLKGLRYVQSLYHVP